MNSWLPMRLQWCGPGRVTFRTGLKFVPPTPRCATILAGSLDLGERAALALAVARQPSILLIDERKGAEVTRAQGLPVTGTLGILDEAARRELISLPEAVERLKQTSFRYPKTIVERLLAEDAKRRSGRQE